MNNKPSCFVGSSSESKLVAEAVKRNLPSDLLDVSPWTQVNFELNKIALQTLLHEVRKHDFAVFVFAPDDLTRLRDTRLYSTRDNVIFELGMFITALGPERCFFLVPETAEPFRIPTDLVGLTVPRYDPNGYNGDLDAALKVACSKVADAVRNHPPLSGLWEIFITDSVLKDANGSMFITYRGEYASARVLIRKNATGELVNREFLYQGRYASAQFALTFEQVRDGDQIIGSMVLRATSARDTMKGISVYWHHDLGHLVTNNFSLKRP